MLILLSVATTFAGGSGEFLAVDAGRDSTKKICEVLDILVDIALTHVIIWKREVV